LGGTGPGKNTRRFLRSLDDDEDDAEKAARESSATPTNQQQPLAKPAAVPMTQVQPPATSTPVGGQTAAANTGAEMTKEYLEAQKPLVAKQAQLTDERARKAAGMSQADWQAKQAGTTANPDVTFKSAEERAAEMQSQQADMASSVQGAAALKMAQQRRDEATRITGQNASIEARYGTPGQPTVVKDASKSGPRPDGPVISDENGVRLAQEGGKMVTPATAANPVATAGTQGTLGPVRFFAGGIPRTPQPATQVAAAPAPVASPAAPATPAATAMGQTQPAKPAQINPQAEDEERKKMIPRPQPRRQMAVTS
jgi:hypothetical protein